MSELVGQGSKYTDEQRRDAAVQYAINGTLAPIVKSTGIPQQTLSHWKKQDWWESVVSEVRSENADKHIAQYTALVSDAIQYAHDNLDNASPKDALIMAATATDKARLLMNQPTSISGKDQAQDKRIQALEAFARDHREKQVRVVDEQ